MAEIEFESIKIGLASPEQIRRTGRAFLRAYIRAPEGLGMPLRKV